MNVEELVKAVFRNVVKASKTGMEIERVVVTIGPGGVATEVVVSVCRSNPSFQPEVV